jgi:hypothetical protein
VGKISGAKQPSSNRGGAELDRLEHAPDRIISFGHLVAPLDRYGLRS